VPGEDAAGRPGAGQACDSHLHVFGPPERYRLRPGLTSAPWSATWDAYRGTARQLGLARHVLVQPSLYGEDNSCLIETLDAAGPGQTRGVVMLGDQAAAPGDATLEKWHALGVRGLRVNCFPLSQAVHSVAGQAAGAGASPEPGWAGAVGQRIQRHAALARELGWHLDLLAPGWLVVELLPVLATLQVDFAVAHLGMFPAADGPAQPGFLALLDLLADGPGHCWVKLSGPYRISQAAAFADVAPMAAALIAAAPDRVIWGSDYPHISFGDQVSMSGMVTLLDWLVPEPADRTRVLVHNPARLYGFAGSDPAHPGDTARASAAAGASRAAGPRGVEGAGG
jgi:2-pyrone-4,6-dicarboxylate lactonase